MLYLNEKYGNCPAMTILEMVIALAIITIIFAAVLPQFRAIKNGWDSRQADAEVLQNGRVLIDHIARNLSKAVRITTVSESTETNGFIQFQDNDGNNFRYDINSASNYVEFGPVGNLSDLAGPVSQLLFTCYDACDLDTPLDITTADINDIRYVEIDATIINALSASQNITFTAAAYLRTNDEASSGSCWVNEDIGDVGAAGNAIPSDSNWVIEASGADIWNTTDEFHFVYQPLSGNGQIIARVVSVENTNSWAKAGVMIRETLDGDSTHAMMVVTPGNGTAFQRRTTTGGSSDHTAGSYVTAPYWVRLVRNGNTLTGYESPDGFAWTQVDSVSINMATDVYIGLAVTSHNDGTLCTAEIDNISLSAVEYQGFTEAKVSTDSDSITISTQGSADTVNILGSWEIGTTHTAEPGSNRAFIVIVHAESMWGFWPPSLSDVTYGGQTMTKIADIAQISGNWDPVAYVGAFVLDETGIAAATDDTISPTWNWPQPTYTSLTSVFLGNVDQTSPVGDYDTAGVTNTATITTSALSTNEGDMVILGGTCTEEGTYTENNDFIQDTDLSVTGFDGTDGHKSATGASETPSITHSTTTNLQALIGLVAQLDEQGGESIEGNLLIAAVATDGDTSTTLSPPAGQGWIGIVDDYNGQVTLGAWYKSAGASEPSSHEFTWSSLNPQQAYGWMMRFTGHDPANPINTYSTFGQTSSSPTSPEVTTTVNNCLILRLGAFDNNDITEDDTGLTGHTTITMDTSSSGSSTITLFSDDFEAGNFNNWTDGGTTDWDLTTAQYVSYNHSAHAGSSDNDLISDNINMSSYNSFTIEFRYRDDDIDNNDNVYLQFYDGSNYDNIFELGNTNPEDTWHNYNATIYNSGGDAQYFNTNFRIKFEATSIDNNENLWIDDVIITVTVNEMVSGGAGYTEQSASGDSGTADFALTASNASQMITVAIAPDSSEGDCEGDIYP